LFWERCRFHAESPRNFTVMDDIELATFNRCGGYAHLVAPSGLRCGPDGNEDWLTGMWLRANFVFTAWKPYAVRQATGESQPPQLLRWFGNLFGGARSTVAAMDPRFQRTRISGAYFQRNVAGTGAQSRQSASGDADVGNPGCDRLRPPRPQAFCLYPSAIRECSEGQPHSADAWLVGTGGRSKNCCFHSTKLPHLQKRSIAANLGRHETGSRFRSDY